MLLVTDKLKQILDAQISNQNVFTQGDAILILENTFKNELGLDSFSVVLSLWSCASKWPLHSWLLSVKCLHCFCLVLVSIELKMQKRPPQLQHACK